MEARKRLDHAARRARAVRVAQQGGGGGRSPARCGSARAASEPRSPGCSVAGGRRGRGRAQPPRYVSRGGLKLERALGCFGVSPAGRLCLDVGRLDRRLHRLPAQGRRRARGRARRRLRRAPLAAAPGSARDRDRARERPRARARPSFPIAPDLIAVDVSFIGLAKVLPAVARCAAPRFDLLALVKPQFELGRERVGKGGVVRGAEDRLEALVAVGRGGARRSGSRCRATASPGLPGPGGQPGELHLVHGGGARGASTTSSRRRARRSRRRASRPVTRLVSAAPTRARDDPRAPRSSRTTGADETARRHRGAASEAAERGRRRARVRAGRRQPCAADVCDRARRRRRDAAGAARQRRHRRAGVRDQLRPRSASSRPPTATSSTTALERALTGRFDVLQLPAIVLDGGDPRAVRDQRGLVPAPLAPQHGADQLLDRGRGDRRARALRRPDRRHARRARPATTSRSAARSWPGA